MGGQTSRRPRVFRATLHHPYLNSELSTSYDVLGSDTPYKETLGEKERFCVFFVTEIKKESQKRYMGSGSLCLTSFVTIEFKVSLEVSGQRLLGDD